MDNQTLGNLPIVNSTVTINNTDTNTAVNGSFNYLIAGGEQTIFELVSANATYISQITLDLVNMLNNGTITLYSKIDGVNYRSISVNAFTVLSSLKGFLINLKVPINQSFKVTYTAGIAELAQRAIPFNYILEA